MNLGHVPISLLQRSRSEGEHPRSHSGTRFIWHLEPSCLGSHATQACSLLRDPGPQLGGGGLRATPLHLPVRCPALTCGGFCTPAETW